MISQGNDTLTQVTARAPAGIGNVAAGFDVLGQALDGPHDRVTLRLRAEPGIEILSIEGVVTDLPADPLANTATAGVARMLAEADQDVGLAVQINKGISLGSGMGGSAASAVAGVVAADALLGLRLSPRQLLGYALDGEEAATGTRHADNVASALLGGLALVIPVEDGFLLRRLPAPPAVVSVLVHPHLRLDTRGTRSVLPARFDGRAVTSQLGLLAGLVSACYEGDTELVKHTLRDTLVEPWRAPLIPGFEQVQRAALDEGALGCSVSGGGPSVFAWCHGEAGARRAGEAMRDAFAGVGYGADIWVSRLDAPGARVEQPCAT